MLLSEDGRVDARSVEMALPAAAGGVVSGASAGTLAERVESFERELLLAELKRHKFHMTEAAKAMGLERSHLYKKCQQLGVDLQTLKTDVGS